MGIVGKIFRLVIAIILMLSVVTTLSCAQSLAMESDEKIWSDSQSYTLPDGSIATYARPDWKHVVTEFPNTAWATLKLSFAPDTLWPWVAIITSSALLYEYDEDILLEVQRQGRDLGLGNEDNTKTIVRAGEINVLRLPTDTGSFLYFIGDGWTHFGIAAGFLYYGVKNEDYRAWNTAYQLVHGMAVSTFYNQILKRSTGREAPTNRTEERGRWRPFPSIKAYGERTADYDAVPSGHVMTGTLVVTIINQNYPEYSHVTIPVGSTLLTLLAWQMMNNGVHWASDYPLGIAMGIFYGNYVAKNWKYKKVSQTSAQNETQLDFLPILSRDTVGLGISYSF